MRKRVVIIYDASQPANASCAQYIVDRLPGTNVLTVSPTEWSLAQHNDATLTVLLYSPASERVDLYKPALPDALPLASQGNKTVVIAAMLGTAPLSNVIQLTDPTTGQRVAVDCVPMQLRNASNPVVNDTPRSQAALAAIQAKLGPALPPPQHRDFLLPAPRSPEQPPQPRGAQINRIGILGTAWFYTRLRGVADDVASRDIGGTQPQTFEHRVKAACEIMLSGIEEGIQNNVIQAVQDKLRRYDGVNSSTEAGAQPLIYACKALMAEDKAFFSENGKRAIGAAAGFFTGTVVIGGGAVGIGAATGSAASEAALEAFKELFNGSAEKFSAELAANNPILIVFLVGIAIGVASLVVGPLTAVEAGERFSGRRAQAKHLEDVVQAALNEEMAKLSPERRV